MDVLRTLCDRVLRPLQARRHGHRWPWYLAQMHGVRPIVGPIAVSVVLGLGRQSERDFQAAVIAFAQMRGYMVAHFHDSRRQVAPGKWIGDRDAAGFPDLVIVGHGRTLFRELKAEKGRVRAEQLAWIEWLDKNGEDVAVWRPSDWPLIERTL